MKITFGYDKYLESKIEYFFSDDRGVFVIRLFRLSIVILNNKYTREYNRIMEELLSENLSQ